MDRMIWKNQLQIGHWWIGVIFYLVSEQERKG